MNISIVHIHVKPEYRIEFMTATEENARASLNEPGVARFDFLQLDEDLNRFVLFEAYRNADARLLHKETAHYQKWRDTVQDMMVESRLGVTYTTIFPDDSTWS